MLFVNCPDSKCLMTQHTLQATGEFFTRQENDHHEVFMMPAQGQFLQACFISLIPSMA